MVPRFTIAEDEASYLYLVEAMLRKKFPQSHIVTFSAAEDALGYILQHGTDILISDHGMGAMSGTELIRRLRQQGRRFPIIMVSGNPEAEQEALDAGADKFIEKGRALQSLEDEIRRRLPQK